MTGREYGLALAIVAQRANLKGMSLEDIAAAAEKDGLSPVPVWTEEEIQQAVEVLRSRLRDGYDPFTAGYREAFKDLADELHAKKGDA